MTPRLGLFDSGVGGFTVLRRILQRHGNVSCLYFADSARVPYGERSRSEIRFIAEEVVTWLREQQVTVVVMACNTTNSLAFDVVERCAGVPVLSLIDAAAGMVEKSRVGVLATPATAASHSYLHHIKAVNPNVFVIEEGCEEFVPLIEAGKLNSDEMLRAVDKHMRPLLEAQVDEIVLGCTHYPLMETLLMKSLLKDIRLIDPAKGLAIQLDNVIGESINDMSVPISIANTRFCVTSNPIGFASMAKEWLGKSPQVEMISLCSSSCLS